MKRMIVLLSGALALVSLVGATAEAQSVEHFKSSDTRVTGYFAVNVCCEGRVVDLDGPADDFEFDLDPGIGFGIRVERRVADWLAIGGMFEMMAAKVDGVDDRFFFIDADIFGKVMYEIELSGSMGLEVYGLIPFGFTAGLDGDETFGDEVRAFGLNTGLLAGAMLMLEHFGIMFEMGFRHHSIWDEADLGIGGNRDVRLGTNQFAMNFGASVTF